MIINWLLGKNSSNVKSGEDKVYPMVFSICEDEVRSFLEWMRKHECMYMINSRTREIINGYTDEELISNRLVSMAFEQYGNDGSKKESDISIVLTPSVLGTKYKLVCRCGEEFEPLKDNGGSKKQAYPRGA